jgi:UDP-2,3-diacylglucosamine pyrophosphatase LpxH
MRGRYRTIWVSDTHLGTRDCQAAALLEFLDGHECEYLYLVGDIIDFWRLRRSPQWAPIHSEVIRAVLAKAGAGTTVTLVPGNHDEYLRRFCDQQIGNILITREAIHRTADGRLLLVVHGDEFDGITRYHRWVALTGDVGYEALLTLNRWFNVGRRFLGLPYWSLSAYVKGKVKRAVSFVCAFESALARHAAQRRLHGVVCGHIHRAEMRDIEGILYCNTGDWVESCTALAERPDGTLELLSMAPRVAEATTLGRAPVPGRA